MMRPIYEIAKEIRANWTPVSPHAKPYLDAMFSLNDISDDYFADSGKSFQTQVHGVGKPQDVLSPN